MISKANNGNGDIPERDLWQTKQEYWNILDKQYIFNFDCCANEANSKCCFFSSNFETTTPEQLNDWVNNPMCWMNPPFSIAFKMFEHFFKVVKRGVAIYRCDNMETKVWQDIILKNADWIFIPYGRVSYTPFEVGDMRNGAGTRFPSALIGIGVEPPLDLKGVVLYLKK